MSQLLCLRLSNPSNSCYINASMITMMWASLQRRHFAMDDWGLLQEDLKLLLGRGDEPTLVPGCRSLSGSCLVGTAPFNVMLWSSHLP